MKPLVLCLMGGVLLAGCASPAPIRFHTLDAGPVLAGGAPGPEASPGGVQLARRALPAARFDVVVTVPERLNRDNIVLTRRTPAVADTSLQVLESERWAAAFGDALRDALTVQLARQVPLLPAAVGDEPAAGPRARGEAPARAAVPMRLDVQVYRFDGGTDGSLEVLLDWRLRRLDARRGDVTAGDGDDTGLRSLECRHVFARQGAGTRVDDVVMAMQQQVEQLAADVATTSQAWLETGRAVCRQAGLADGLPEATGHAGQAGAVIGH
ncbi:MAG: ABC-type transport auxiliary lipoprotein family protein [Lautropia sp.]|nr:ABC-type transport auxiliary lipoprotein family protein [Lautropia sp.]